MQSNLFWLSDEQWAEMKPLLPSDVPGKERVDDRRGPRLPAGQRLIRRIQLARKLLGDAAYNSAELRQ